METNLRPSGSPILSGRTEEESMEQLCPTRVELAKPRRLLNTDKKWRVIVNIGPKFQQTVRLETCLQTSCGALLPPCYGSICVQKYAYHRLLSYDPCSPEKGLFIDTYRLPIACSCAII
eukprot:04861.XXX_159267_158449_1 [CDS] Oithona nana genome sequencing.